MLEHRHGTSRVLRRATARTLLAAGMALAGAGVCAMDLHQAYEAALANDAAIMASRSAAQAGMERVPQALSQLLPNASLQVGRNLNHLDSRTNNFLGQPTSSYTRYFSDNRTLSIRQPLFRPYATAQLRQAHAQERDAQATLQVDEQTLVTRVGEAYFSALLARDQLELIAAQKTAYETQLDAARKMFAAGTGTRTDIDDAQARLDMTVAQELEVRQNLVFTRHQLEVLTGGPVDELARLDEQGFAPQALEPAAVQIWIERAEEASPQLRSLRAQVEIAQQEEDKARAGHLPTLDAVAQWSRTDSDSVTSVNSHYNNKVIGLQLNIPLYSGGYVNSTMRQAAALTQRAREALEAARRDLGVRVHQEVRNLTEGALRIKALEQAVHSAEQAVVSSRKSREAGVRTVIDVLNAQQQKTVALRDLAQARYLFLLSQLRLHALVGDDRQANVRAVNAWLRH